MASKPLWAPNPENIQNSHMQALMHELKCGDYESLHRYSIENKEAFWEKLWQFCRIKGHLGTQTLTNADHFEQSIWFADSTLNFAENLLSSTDNTPAILYANERGERLTLTYAELAKHVDHLSRYLHALGLQAGDRVSAFLPNSPETVIAMLACTKLGLVWSSCSSEFGYTGLYNRFEQIQPKLLFATNGHNYQGKTFTHLEKLQALQNALPSIQQTILVNHLNIATPEDLAHTISFEHALTQGQTLPAVEFEQFPFNHPVYILYSSGTTGKPKCMVHGAGGTLIQHKKELFIHTDLKPKEHFFCYTTTGWMMWNWLVSGLSVGAAIVLYEGAPNYPTSAQLMDLIAELQINVFGSGAKYFELLEKSACKPAITHDLSSLRTILTTGSPLLPTSFDYIYRDIKPTVQLSSISGGSDIISCFALGNPILPVYRGELQCLGLGMSVEIFDGELVCTQTFPSKPIYFWNDPDNKKFHHAYFDKYPNVWAHGDLAKITGHNGLIIYGRSDATLNPGGVRIGTAEIYNQVEKIKNVVDCLATSYLHNQQEYVVLFVVLREGVTLTEDLTKQIKQTIRENTTPRHVPTAIFRAPDLPRTISGKLMEIAVKKIINGQTLGNVEALANPESLDYFKNLPKPLV